MFFCGHLNVAPHLSPGVNRWFSAATISGSFAQPLAQPTRPASVSPFQLVLPPSVVAHCSHPDAQRRGAAHIMSIAATDSAEKYLIFGIFPRPRSGNFIQRGHTKKKKQQHHPTVCEKSFQIVSLKCYDQQCIIEPRQRPIGWPIPGSG